MPNYKVNHFFEEFDQGWTETFYLSSSQSPQAIASYSPADRDAVVGWRSPGVVFQSIRVADADNPRTAFLFIVNQSVAPKSGVSPDITATMALIQLNAASGAGQRHLWLRGLRDQDTVRDDAGNSVPSANLVIAMNNYINLMLAKQYAIRVLRNRTVNPFIPVVSFAPQNATSTVVTLGLLAPLPVVGDVVYFTGVPEDDLPGLRGQFRVIGQAGNTFTIPYRYRNQANQVIPSKPCFYRKALYDYNAIGSGRFERFGSRDTGRPTTRFRGRRRGQIFRQ